MTKIPTKTPPLGEMLAKFNAYNDQLWYYSFATEQLNSLVMSLEHDAQVAFTTEVFPRNSKAPKIHIRVSALPEFGRVSYQTALGAFISGAYETAVSYMEEALRHLHLYGTSDLQPTSAEVPEDRLRNGIRANGGDPGDDAVWRTLAYCRLRRNQIVHLRDEPTDELRKLVRYKGRDLNSYWGHSALLDFSRTPLPILDEREAIGLLAVLRSSLLKLDPVIASLLNSVKLLAELDRSLRTDQPHLSGRESHARRARKLETIAYHLYGMEWGRAEIADALWREDNGAG